jgi:hypothetical protein
MAKHVINSPILHAKQAELCVNLTELLSYLQVALFFWI